MGLPGRLVELGETLREGAQREVHEEYGTKIIVGDVIDAVDVIQHDEDARLQFHCVVVDLVVTYLSGDLRAGDDVLDARWLFPCNLDSYVLPTRTREVINKAVVRKKK